MMMMISWWSRNKVELLLPPAVQPWLCRYQSQSDQKPLGSVGGRRGRRGTVQFVPSSLTLLCFSKKTWPRCSCGNRNFTFNIHFVSKHHFHLFILLFPFFLLLREDHISQDALKKLLWGDVGRIWNRLKLTVISFKWSSKANRTLSQDYRKCF